eukprot:gnl/Trimastix_PCT/3576.p1 GENE.gnl/Trimastix_PCT/3576~~gnl/Trimastix_PCT/3576.p1  ORF type:complete len:275 (-),score=9.54 gnl/Trimastix_PCT/3576:292-1116(-)
MQSFLILRGVTETPKKLWVVWQHPHFQAFESEQQTACLCDLSLSPLYSSIVNEEQVNCSSFHVDLETAQSISPRSFSIQSNKSSPAILCTAETLLAKKQWLDAFARYHLIRISSSNASTPCTSPSVSPDMNPRYRHREIPRSPIDEDPVLLDLPQTPSPSSPNGDEAGSPGCTLNYVIRFGDTLGSIASRFECSESQIKRVNHLISSRLIPGCSLRIPISPLIKTPVPRRRSLDVSVLDTQEYDPSASSLYVCPTPSRNHLTRMEKDENTMYPL